MGKRIDTKGLKFKLWGLFMLFAASIMLALWLLQIVFLQISYQSMKINEIKKIGDSLVREYGQNGFDDFIYKQSFNNGIAVQIFDQDGNPMMIPGRNDFGDMRPPKTDPQTLATLISKLSQSQNGKTSYITSDQRLKGQILAYGAVLSDSSGKKTYLYLTSQIAPIDATTTVLKNQLIMITAISLLLSTVLSLLIASRLARPIIKITHTASRLANGDYGVRFENGNYTEINQLAATLNYATSELSKTEQLRRELIANISHDLRTPLTMVKMYAELIHDVSGTNPEKRNMHTQVIIEEADRLSALITDMLDLSKLQSGTAQIRTAEFDLSEKAGTILNRFHALAERDGYVFNIQCDPNAIVTADAQKIEQVIYNLVSNAVNYTGEDKTIFIRVKKTINRKVRFEVQDTGNGISDEQISQIWERYYKASENHRRAVVGTGLGLSIVKSILEAHHAQYGVESTVGKGSTFWFELE